MTKPKWDQTDALRRGKTASRLAAKKATVLDPFLSPGAREALLEARARLGDESAIKALGNQKTQTAAKSDAAERLEALIMAARNAVDRTDGATQEQRTAVGIGERLPTDAKRLEQVERIVKNRDILVSCGIIAPVVEAMIVGAGQLRIRMAEQGQAMDERADTTEERLDAHLTIQRLVDEISSRGRLAITMAGDEVLAARFDRLVSTEGPTAEDEQEAGEDENPTTPTPEPTPVVTP